MSENAKTPGEQARKEPRTLGEEPHSLREEESPEPESSPIPPEAIFSPDDPIAQPVGEIPEDAIYSPDDPILIKEVVDGVVTRMSGKEHGDPRASGNLAWEIRHAANIMNALSQALRERGVEALKLRPETEPLDAILRSFVAGYLVGRTDRRD